MFRQIGQVEALMDGLFAKRSGKKEKNGILRNFKLTSIFGMLIIIKYK